MAGSGLLRGLCGIYRAKERYIYCRRAGAHEQREEQPVAGPNRIQTLFSCRVQLVHHVRRTMYIATVARRGWSSRRCCNSSRLDQIIRKPRDNGDNASVGAETT